MLSVLLICAFALSLCSCGQSQGEDGEISIVCTLFPQYDWVRNVVGDTEGVSLTLLIQNGTDPHSYQPTAADILAISNCDAIVYLGGESDLWVQEALERAGDPDIIKIALTDIEGMTLREISAASHSHGHEGHGDHSDHSDHSGHGHGTLDEHLWLSLRNAAVATAHIAERLCELDGANGEIYAANAEEYIARLNSLDSDYRATVESASEADRFALFADRFPFVYMMEDYGIEYSAAFEGCTADVDADFDTVIRLIEEAAEHDVRYIAVTESSDGALARTVADSGCDIEIITMNSLQSITRERVKEGVTYLSVMEDNLISLAKILKLESSAEIGE